MRPCMNVVISFNNITNLTVVYISELNHGNKIWQYISHISLFMQLFDCLKQYKL